jgi:hypothetical protein
LGTVGFYRSLHAAARSRAGARRDRSPSRRHFSKLSAADVFSGVALVARNGVPVFMKAYGMPDREKKIANTIRTRFNIGSINKEFTQTAIRQLVRPDKLSPDDTLGKFFPDYPQVASRNALVERHGPTPSFVAWRRHRPPTRRAIPRPPSCTESSETISRPSARKRRRCATARASRASWSRSFATSSAATVWPAASRAFAARPAASINSSPSRARAAGSARAVVRAWRPRWEGCRLGALPRLLANHIPLLSSASLPKIEADDGLIRAVEGGRG